LKACPYLLRSYLFALRKAHIPSITRFAVHCSTANS
jgi:hypothetical protein